ncbi:MAG: hypothetical protein JRE71_01300 [Deltaproteobacteria bacterium]|nr:hypothetical protein [Deltaproteobacteria bacterium]
MVRRALTLLLIGCCVSLLGSRCGGGDGSGGRPPTLRISETECAPLFGKFPPGFDWLPGGTGHAVAVLDTPPAALFLDMNGDKPRLLTKKDELNSVPPDSDGDGEIDEDQRLCDADEISEFVVPGTPLGISPRLAFVAGSGYEQVMFFRAPDGELTELEVTNPPDTPSGSYHGEDYPYLPEASASRTAITTRSCVYLEGEDALASTGDPVGRHPCCQRVPDAASFFTSFTAGMNLAAGHLFVATSNLDLPNNFLGRYFPGTVLVYDFDPATDPPSIQPNVDTPLIFTSGFNPTGVARYTTPLGRELVFVTNSGAIGPGIGQSNILSESFIDVIDAASRRLVATIPMGYAGLSFDALAIDPTRRVGMIGSWTLPVLYAIDLRVFDDDDDDSLYRQAATIWLDGSDPEFPDARIFSADNSFEIPDRKNGPHPILCDGWTFVAINQAGESAYVLERCDGTLTQVNLLDPIMSCEAAGGSDRCCEAIPLPESCFSLGSIQHVTEPFNTVTGPHGPSHIRVRPGEPGVDFTGPDVFYTVDLPEGQLCGVRMDSF